MSTNGTNRQVIVTELPTGKLSTSNFEVREGPMPEASDGEVLVRTLWLSLDAANRAWMQGATYTDPVFAGQVMSGFTLGQVVASNSPDVPAGAIVECQNGWQAYGVHAAKAVRPFEPKAPLPRYLSVLGVTGLTAYFGLHDVGRPEAGETVVVSAAGGATGSVVGQLARLRGCRAVGIAGSDDKNRWLVDELGFDAAVNYKDPGFRQQLKAACPDGVDVYFDNTGGPILETVLRRMNLHGRIACCGVVSQYDTSNPAAGPAGIPGLLVTKRIRMEGFIVMDFYDRRAQALDELAGWVNSGELKVAEDVVEGLEHAPAGLVGLLAGENMGKRMVHVADPT
ncbi:MAG: NADP-dependent oxidoreductase [Actinomycetota bacterium]|nr:NADP-dependent oxidoreductase [Actinomycetota bacterium]